MGRGYASEGLRKLSRYLKSVADQLEDFFIGDRMRPAYVGISDSSRRDYTNTTDRENLDGNAIWAKHGGKLHQSKSGRILKIHAGNGRGVIDVDMNKKPKDKTVFDWIGETYNIGRDKVSQALKGFK